MLPNAEPAGVSLPVQPSSRLFTKKPHGEIYEAFSFFAQNAGPCN